MNLITKIPGYQNDFKIRPNKSSILYSKKQNKDVYYAHKVEKSKKKNIFKKDLDKIMDKKSQWVLIWKHFMF